MALTMDLEESVSDSKLQKKEARPSSALSHSKSDHGPVESTSSIEQLRQYKSWVSNERWNELKKLADNAMRDHKVFMIKGGGFPAVRRALIERGWIEKYESHKARHPPPTLDPKKASGKELSKVERMILYKFMEHHSVDFLWTTKRDKYDWLLSSKEVIISRSIFTTKEGLTTSLTQMHWHTEPGIALTKFPRCYNIYNSDSLEEFIDDFRITACISLLKWLCNAIQSNEEYNLAVPIGKVPFSAVEFAMSRLNEYISFFTHKDIDDAEDQNQHIWEHEWDQFLTHHYLLVHEKAKFIEDKNNSNLRSLERKASKILATMTKYWPQLDIDGVLNIWIVKPGNKCRGKGIQLMNNIKDIIGLINIPSAQKTRYVVQKYIENPLVVYDTKFDIRQWFLITNSQPLTIWVYKDSYLRFSSQMFSLSNYHESVHLTNNAVQTKYKNNNNRDKALPDENMWDCHTFKAYLRQIGKYDMWDTRIYPGIKQCLVGAMLACQDTMDKRQNSFELYGADFMLSEDFTPWLIEINSSPDLAPTTSVTARLCPQCLEDVIKVVIDRKNNIEADTGTFELVYKQVIPKAPAYLGLSLCLNGKKIHNNKKAKEKKQEARILTTLTSHELSRDTLLSDKDQPMPAEYSGPIITDFLSWLNPYDVLPTDKDGIVLGANETCMVRKALTVVKSGLVIKNASKKRKSSNSSRTHRGRRERNLECKRKIVPHSCCQNEALNIKHSVRYLTESASKLEKSKIEKSVGNKRCYIDPIDWERETASILRSTISVKNKLVERSNSSPLIRQTKSSVIVSSQKNMLSTISTQKYDNNEASLKNLSAVGKSISKIREENKVKQKNLRFSENFSSIYAPFRVVSPLIENDFITKSKK